MARLMLAVGRFKAPSNPISVAGLGELVKARWQTRSALDGGSCKGTLKCQARRSMDSIEVRMGALVAPPARTCRHSAAGSAEGGTSAAAALPATATHRQQVPAPDPRGHCRAARA